MSKLLNSIFNKLSRKKRSCHDCIYLEDRSTFLGVINIRGDSSSKSSILFNCGVYGTDIKENEANVKSCWRFGRKKEGIPIERQINDHWINRLKRNWDKIIIVLCTIIGTIIGMIAILKTLNII